MYSKNALARAYRIDAEIRRDVATDFARRSWAEFVARCRQAGVTSYTATLRAARADGNRVDKVTATLIRELCNS